jgi:hypothetical protein
MRIGITLWNYGMRWLPGRGAEIALEELAVGRDAYVHGPITHKGVFRTMVF